MNSTTIIEGGCHCGNINYIYKTEVATNKIPLRKCGCSFCSKQGAIYTSDPNGKLIVKIESKKHINNYQFSTKQVNFVFCTKCGVMPLSTTKINQKLYALINVNTSNKNINKSSVTETDFSKETVSESIERRKSKWISAIEGI